MDKIIWVKVSIIVFAVLGVIPFILGIQRVWRRGVLTGSLEGLEAFVLDIRLPFLYCELIQTQVLIIFLSLTLFKFLLTPLEKVAKVSKNEIS